MILFKACPRCQGDMHRERDMYGEYDECLMCGYMSDLRKSSSFTVKPAPARKRATGRRGSSTETVRAA